MVYSENMAALPSTSRRRYTLAEYLDFEETAPWKHEFHNGEILAMSGASPEHALITASALRVIGNRLEGKPSRVYSSDLKIAVGPNADVQYPDGSVICGPLEFHPADPTRRLVVNPRVIVEVLSPTTEGYDRGEKFILYRTLASFEEYVLISQTTALVETFLRQPDGRFLIDATYTGLDATARINSLQIQLPLADIYAGVTFPEHPTRPAFNEGEIE
jgi:Uma2 family endonuclease